MPKIHDLPAMAFDRLTTLATALFDAPISLVSFVEDDCQWFNSAQGLQLAGTPIEDSFCVHTIALGNDGVMVIEDASDDPRFRDNPLVTGEPGIRFYAGAVIPRANGESTSALCVIDTKPRSRPSEGQLHQLTLLAQMAGIRIEALHNERLIRERSEMLTMAEAMSGVGHWRLDLATNGVAWSDEVYRIHGVSRATFDPQYDDAIGFYHPDDRQTVQDWVKHVIETGEGYDFKLRLIRADGDERIVVSRAVAERDDSGQVVAIFGLFQDVTEAELASQRVADSEQRYRLLADRATDVIGTYGMDGVFRYLSPSILNILGYETHELVGRTFSDFIYPEDVAGVSKAFSTYVKAGAGAPSPRIPYRAMHKNGTLVWLEAHPNLIRDAAGNPLEFQDVVRDVSDTKQLEDALIVARDRAEAGAVAKSEFLANMSHELRTPLTSVIGFSGLLQASKALPDAERKYADRIATASEALLSVINDILDYSKLEADAIQMEPTPFDPRLLAEGAVGLLEGQCATKGLALVADIDAALPEGLVGDEGRVRQVVLNFLSNAVKFTASGTVTLGLGGSEMADGRWMLKVAVSDTGIGIAQDKIEALFDRFTQADASTTRVYGGTGLGLAISRRLIELMGGEVGADSRPGEGSTFWFTVPMAQAQAVSIDADDSANAVPMTARILMADDVPANRELVGAILSGLGLSLDTVCDGAEAIEAVRANSYDLVLMDVHMPVMDGLEATRSIRAMPGPAGRTPIVALTANVQREQVERCLAAGMDGHLSKPIQIAELVGTLQAWLSADNDSTAESGLTQAVIA